MNRSDENVVGRLKSYRVWLAFSLVFIVGAACTVVSFGAERHWFELSGPLALIPWLAIGEAFLSAVVIGLIYERFVRRESEKELNRILSAALDQQTESTVAKVVSAAALTLDSLRRLSRDELDAAFRRVLTVRLNDEALADEVVKGIVPQAVGTVDRFVDLRHRIQLLPDGDLPEHPLRYMTVRVTVSSRRVLKRDVLRFGICEEMTPVYAKLGDSVQWDVLWSPGRLHYYSVNDPRTFCVEYVQINDMMLDIARLPMATKDQVEHRVEARMERQQVLTKDDPLKLWAIVDEAALTRLVGGTDVMHTQLRHLG